ncbi:homeobox protein Meis3 isoform X8 [Phocoena sinus]|uniref:homeobox protein Meis3 isoform X8 n=1 Tax=Phocoena sinus TaxID=42100 RepID=UPI0013C4B1A2|nr:homeobox protein Meis3 isoform X8 [Phocoena sinus]
MGERHRHRDREKKRERNGERERLEDLAKKGKQGDGERERRGRVERRRKGGRERETGTWGGREGDRRRRPERGGRRARDVERGRQEGWGPRQTRRCETPKQKTAPESGRTPREGGRRREGRGSGRSRPAPPRPAPPAAEPPADSGLSISAVELPDVTTERGRDRERGRGGEGERRSRQHPSGPPTPGPRTALGAAARRPSPGPGPLAPPSPPPLGLWISGWFHPPRTRGRDWGPRGGGLGRPSPAFSPLPSLAGAPSCDPRGGRRLGVHARSLRTARRLPLTAVGVGGPGTQPPAPPPGVGPSGHLGPLPLAAPSPPARPWRDPGAAAGISPWPGGLSLLSHLSPPNSL